jgi:hypothetical protein
VPAFPSIDLTKIDLSKIDLSKIDLSKIDLSKVDLSGVDVKLPDVDTERLVGLARDAAYVGIGFGVLAVQQAQVRRREVRSTVERQIRQLVDAAR